MSNKSSNLYAPREGIQPWNGPLTESRSYNNLMQLTQLTNTGVNMQYIYTAGQNNGRVSQTIDGVLGETVNYTYDMWNRLITATATNGTWGEAYTYDNFGNLIAKAPTVGSAPAMNVPANNSNQPSGSSVDANGNSLGETRTTQTGGMWRTV